MTFHETMIPIIVAITALLAYVVKITSNLKRPDNLIIEEGKITISAIWSWKNLGYIQNKAFYLENGVLKVVYL